VKSARARGRRRGVVALRLAIGTLVAWAAAGDAGAQQTMTFGRDVATAPHAQFKPGVTTMAEVRAALGDPRGDGVARHNPKEPQRIIWFYEYGQVRPRLGDTESSLKIVLVFFKEGRYDGHLWFADKKIVSTQLSE
jgi:hypothetical protein